MATPTRRPAGGINSSSGSNSDGGAGVAWGGGGRGGTWSGMSRFGFGLWLSKNVEITGPRGRSDGDEGADIYYMQTSP